MLAEGRHPASAAPRRLCHSALASPFMETGNWPTYRWVFVSSAQLYSKEKRWKPLSRRVKQTYREPVVNLSRHGAITWTVANIWNGCRNVHIGWFFSRCPHVKFFFFGGGGICTTFRVNHDESQEPPDDDQISATAFLQPENTIRNNFKFKLLRVT